MSTSPLVALLRGINVSGHNKIPMAELRSICSSLGWLHVQSYIQSGNIVFQSDSAAAQLEAELEQAIQDHFHLTIPVIIRTASQWSGYIQHNPFPEQSQSQPNLVMLALSKASPNADAAERLRERAMSGEQIIQTTEALWVHYTDGVASSRLSPALFDRLAGSPVTARNWRTVLKIEEMING